MTGRGRIFGSSKYYVRSTEEMWQIFGKNVLNHSKIHWKLPANVNSNLPLDDNLSLPGFPIPADSKCQTTDEYFRKVVLEGFEQRKETIWNEQIDKGFLKYSH